MNVLVVATLAACGGPDTRATAPPTAVEAPSDTRGDTSSGTPDHAGADHTRPAQARATLPLALATLVPRNGIFAAGGGLVSPAWRVVVDIDANTVFGGSMDGASTSSTGPMDHESRRALTPRNKNHLMQMAYSAWAEPAPSKPSAPTADYDEVLVVAEGDQVFYLEGYGPIRQPLAAATIVEVRAAAGL